MNAAIFPPKSPQEAAPANPPSPATAVQTAAINSNLRPGIKPQPSPQRVDPRSLVGKNQGDVRDMLGVPGDIRDAAPATIWRYRTSGCALEIFFYMDLGTNTLRALTYDAKIADAASDDNAAAQCIGAIQSTNRVTSR